MFTEFTRITDGSWLNNIEEVGVISRDENGTLVPLVAVGLLEDGRDSAVFGSLQTDVVTELQVPADYEWEDLSGTEVKKDSFSAFPRFLIWKSDLRKWRDGADTCPVYGYAGADYEVEEAADELSNYLPESCVIEMRMVEEPAGDFDEDAEYTYGEAPWGETIVEGIIARTPDAALAVTREWGTEQ